jgi:hypothetical protein
MKNFRTIYLPASFLLQLEQQGERVLAGIGSGCGTLLFCAIEGIRQGKVLYDQQEETLPHLDH